MKERINVTPTWTELLPTLIQGVQSPDLTARRIAEEELRRIALAADLLAAQQRVA